MAIPVRLMNYHDISAFRNHQLFNILSKPSFSTNSIPILPSQAQNNHSTYFLRLMAASKSSTLLWLNSSHLVIQLVLEVCIANGYKPCPPGKVKDHVTTAFLQQMIPTPKECLGSMQLVPFFSSLSSSTMFFIHVHSFSGFCLWAMNHARRQGCGWLKLGGRWNTNYGGHSC